MPASCAPSGAVTNNRAPVLLWWSSDITIGSAFLIPAGVVLLVTQEAAGRSRRDGLEPLYESYPVSAAIRTGGLLAGVLGPLARLRLKIGRRALRRRCRRCGRTRRRRSGRCRLGS
jgi:hypothetical protein